MKTFQIAISEGHIEVLFVETETVKEAIEQALRESSFMEPEYVDTDGVVAQPQDNVGGK